MTTKELFKCAEYCLTSNNCEDCPKGSKEECPFECKTSTHTLYNILKQAVAEIEAAKNSLPACPFCGSDNVHTNNILLIKEEGTLDTWQTVCANCGASTEIKETKAEAIAAWRMRNNG